MQHTYHVLLVTHIITVQGIRNDDQSLSPVTPLVSLLLLGREGGREGAREGGRERGREGGSEGGREGRREHTCLSG